MPSRCLWRAFLCLSTLQVLTVVEGLADLLLVREGDSLSIDTEKLKVNLPSIGSQFDLDSDHVNCSDGSPGSSSYHVAVLRRKGSVTFEKGSIITITGNRSLSIESIEGDVTINADIEMTCKTSNGEERCLGAYTETECSTYKWFTGKGQWKPEVVKVCDSVRELFTKRTACLPGASHAGMGGRSSVFDEVKLLQSYGTDDLQCMSGGSAGFSKSGGACFGGGAIEIKAKQGRITIGSTISASAHVLDSSKKFTGCSGGLIRLLANEIKMKNGASLKVDGSNGGQGYLFDSLPAIGSGNGGGAGGVIQIVAPKVALRSITLAAGKPGIGHCQSNDDRKAKNGVLWIKSTSTNFTLKCRNSSLKYFEWPPASPRREFQNASLANLHLVSQQLAALKDMLKEGITHDKLGELFINLNHLLNMSRDNLTEKELLQYLDIFGNYTEIIAILCNKIPLAKTREIFEIILKIASNVTARNNQVNWKELEKLPNFLNTLDSMMLSISNSTNSSAEFEIKTETAAVQLNQFVFDGTQGYRFPSVHDKLLLDTFITEQDFVYIPKTALPQPKTSKEYKFVMFFFKDIQGGLPDSAKQSQGSQNSPKVASLLMSCSLYSNGVPITTLMSPATLNFVINQTLDNTMEGKAQCVFWNIHNNSWDNEGVSVKSSNSSQTACTTTHFTSFAVLMQHTTIPLTKAEELSLKLITYIGCGVSTVALLIALIVFITIEALSSDRHRIHLNLVIALLLAQILFLSGLKATEHKILCKVIAGALHYFYMTSFMWMLIEGVHLYLKVVKVFGIENMKFKQYFIIGWGLPALIVGAAAIVKPYGYGTKYVCWLSLEDGFVWAFIGPVLAIIAINIFILVAVIKTVVASASTMRSSDHSHIKAGIKGALVLMPLMGITWGFGLLAVNRDSLIFQYIFSIANSLQGFFIFLLHIVFNNEVRQAFKRHREKRQLSRESGDYNASVSNSNESDRRTLGKSSSNNSMTGLGKIKARLSMSLMPRTSRVVQVKPLKNSDDDLQLSVKRTYHHKSDDESEIKPKTHSPLRKVETGSRF